MKFAVLLGSILALAFPSSAQKLPDKIRGYKVYSSNIVVADQTDQDNVKDKADVLVRFGTPNISAGVLSASIDIGADITSLKQGGQVDFLTFHDFRINGVAVEIDEYRSVFSFKKNTSFSLPHPAHVTVGIIGIARTAYKELIESKKEWSVTGNVFVFGKFSKFGFAFKRVVPVKIALTIKNPLTK